MKKIILCFVIVISSVSNALAYDGWSEGTIISLRYYSTQILLQQTTASNPGGCADTSYIVIKTSNSGFDHFNAALLTAHASNMNVKLALEGCSGGGTTGYPVIVQVWLLPGS